VQQCVFDPALLDCAGQLVAFWLLEAQGREPSFGVFPFRLQRLQIARAPLPPGSRVHAAARITEREGLTRAEVTFTTEDGRVLMSVEGLEQRVVMFPPACNRRLIAGDPTVVIHDDEAEFLASSFGIWERTLAHLALSTADRAAWAAFDGPPDQRVRWLIDTLAR
jgi:hypothetical protein